MVFKNGLKNIQAAGYNDVRTVCLPKITFEVELKVKFGGKAI